jgi:serine/threonine-protein kinase
MSDAIIDQLRPLFERALELPRTQRDAFVIDSCSGDLALQNELSSLLSAHDESDGFFEKLAEELVGPALLAIEKEDETADSDRNVSHYQIIEKIGGGGMGIVYKARDTRLGRTVALKFLPRHHAENPAAKARLLAEARAASALDHANIGVVYEIGEASDGRQFIAMAWYDGETLKERIRREQIALPDAIDITTQLAAALGAAHSAGIIHRDVKPANVIVTKSGSVKLVDFGIAKLIADGDNDTHATAGTVAYMSPEQTRRESLDARTDVWSLGVVLYELLAGQRPFRGDGDAEVVSAIREEQPTQLSALRSDVPAQIAGVIDRCLKKNRQERFASMEDLRDALRASGKGRTRLKFALITATIAAVAGVAWFASDAASDRDAPGGSTARKASVAVLPFVSSSAADSIGYLTEGLSEEIRTELTRIPSVAVPDYLSSVPYAVTPKPITRIASEMSADYVVTGKAESAPTGAHVQVFVYSGKDGHALWSGAFDTSTGGAARIGREIAKLILSKIDVRIAPAEQSHLDLLPTKNPVAYELYLRGRYAELAGLPRAFLGAPDAERIREAQAFYTRAKTLDPAFAMARARLAATHMASAMTYDTTQARLEQARLEAETALRLDSLIPDAHDVLARYWSRKGDSKQAVDELERALRRTPNDVRLMASLGARYTEAGRWDDAVSELEAASRIDPRNARALFSRATALGRLRRFAEGQKVFSRLIEVSPTDYDARVIKGQAYLRWKGSADTLDALLQEIPRGWDSGGMVTFGRYTVLRVQRRYREALIMLDSSGSKLSRDGLVYHPASLMRAEIYHDLGDSRKARRNYEIARAVMIDSIAVHPADRSIHAALGLAYAGLGRKREAIAEAERAMDVNFSANSGKAKTAFMGIGVETFARVGEHDRAFQMLELMFSMASGREVTPAFLRAWPGFDPLRKDPRFDELIQRFTVK